MVVFKTLKGLREHLAILDHGDGIGLVPTMGALHPGHVSLVDRALRENRFVVVSIFVNPTQFDNPEDLKKYPESLQRDFDLLEQISEDIIVFVPTVDEMYPDGPTSKTYDFAGLDKVMEGAFRSGHFDGVGTVVEKLLTTIKPDRAYFGEKDFQQLQIVRRLVEIQDIPVKIVGCPIVREANGLAMSSRNERLSEGLRDRASFIYRTLQAAKAKFGTKSAHYVADWVRKEFADHPDFQLEYIGIMNAETLAPVNEKQTNENYRAFVAVYADGVRLIDNIAL